MSQNLRLATLADLPGIRALIPSSVRGLNAGHYTAAQLDASLAHVFGADTQLVRDRTYYVVEVHGRIIASGGWSARATLYGGDQMKEAEDRRLDPAAEPARIRAFFVHPDFARRGLGRLLIDTCVAAARSAGFSAIELGSTLPGVALYAACGFTEIDRIEQPMPNGLTLLLVRMRRSLKS